MKKVIVEIIIDCSWCHPDCMYFKERRYDDFCELFNKNIIEHERCVECEMICERK